MSPAAARAAPLAAIPATPSRPARRHISNLALQLTLDRSSAAAPLYRQIRDGVRAAVLSGALAGGVRLPPERELAGTLGVNRGTITRAYGELLADGILAARPGRGTTVRAPSAESLASPDRGAQSSGEAAWLLGLPPIGHGQLGPDPGLLHDMAAIGARSDLISFALGTPAADLVPLAALQSCLTAGLADAGAAGLGYSAVEGHEGLRVAIAARLATRGVRAGPEEILITSGATQGIALIAQALLEPGDEVAVEAPTYLGALQTLAAAGARLVGVPLDDDGLRVDLLESLLARRRIRLVLVQASQQNPTGTTLLPARRQHLLALGRRYGVPIVEDDVYGELWHTPPDPQPLKALDRGGHVLTLGSFSKTVAPGLRVGWLVAPPAVVRRLALTKQFADLNSNALAQLALVQFLTSGDYDQHLTRVRQAYAERRAAMLAALAAVSRLQVSTGARGGYYLWCRLVGGLPARRIAGAAGRAGVAVLPGEAFYPPNAPGGDDGRDRLRLSFSGATPQAIQVGVARLAALLDEWPAPDAAERRPERVHPLV